MRLHDDRRIRGHPRELPRHPGGGNGFLAGSLGKEFDPHLLAHISHGFEQSVNVIAKGLGYILDGFDVFGETANARERFLLPGGTPIEKGTVAAQRISVSGMLNGKPIIRYRLNWYCATNVDEHWDLRRSGWRVLIEGETPIDVNAHLSYCCG